MKLKHTLRRGLELLALVFAAAATTGMLAIVAIIVTSVLMRKFANSPLHITEEVVGLLLSVSLFLGLPMVTLRAKHVRVSILADQLPARARDILQILALCVGIGFFCWLIFESLPWFEFAFKRNLKTETTRILLYPWMALMPLSLVLTGAILIARLFGLMDRLEDGNDMNAGEADPSKAGD